MATNRMGTVRIGFIFPSSDYLHDPFRGDPHTHFQILTVLEQRFGAAVELFLVDLRGIKRESALYHIPQCDLYLHSAYTLDIAEQTAIVAALRRRFPAAAHVAGGPHAAVFQSDCLKIFDSLAIGDGEETIVQAVKDFRDGGLKPVYRQEEPVDVNAYPVPLRKYLPASAVARPGLMTLKRKAGYDALMSTTVIFSRGCPYRCSFCAIPQAKGQDLGIRYRSPEWVEKEIEYLKREYHMQGISLLDEISLPLSRAQAIRHLEAIGRTGILWRGQCRVDGVTPELAELAAQSGCITMCLGVESVSQVSLDLINKKIKVEQARETIRLLKRSGIETRIYMILGLPGEPADIVEQSWSFIRETDPDLVYLSLFTVRPGTAVYEHPERFGIRWVQKDWSKTMHMHGRYGDEVPTLTFEYADPAPWGKPFSKQQIVDNYRELQSRLKRQGLNTLAVPAESHVVPAC